MSQWSDNLVSEHKTPSLVLKPAKNKSETVISDLQRVAQVEESIEGLDK